MKRLFFQKFLCVLCAVAALLTLSGCAGQEEPAQTTEMEIITLPPPPTTEDPASLIDPEFLAKDMKVVLVAGELYTLDKYPNLKSVDLSGSTCYKAIEEFIAEHPHIKVTYTVDLGGTQIPYDADTAKVDSGAFEFSALLENLQYLHQLTTLSLPANALTSDEVSQIVAAYPHIALSYTVVILGEPVQSDTTELDMQDMTSDQVSQAAAQLALMPNLETVKLSNDLPMEDVAALQDACPNTTFVYSFSLFGKTLSTTDTEIVYEKHSIGNSGEDKIRQALTILDNCTRFVLDSCQLDYEVLAQIREDFRDGPNVVWRVYFGKDNRYTALTDDEMIRAVYNVTDETCEPLKYCEGAKYMDIGHNETLTDLSFVSGMPNLEVLIASGCAVKELVGFENCKKLTWLELASCHKLTNLDSLSGCESLRFLNISYTKVTSLMALDTLPLERFVYLSPRASTAEQNTFVAIHDGCRSVFYGYSNPWTPWRYDDNGKTYNAYYKEVVRKAFNYDYLETLLPDED